MENRIGFNVVDWFYDWHLNWRKCCPHYFIDAGCTLWHDTRGEERPCISGVVDALTHHPKHVLFPPRWYAYMSKDRVEETCSNTLKLKKQALGNSFSFGQVRLGGTWKFVWETDGDALAYVLSDWCFLGFQISGSCIVVNREGEGSSEIVGRRIKHLIWYFSMRKVCYTLELELS